MIRSFLRPIASAVMLAGMCGCANNPLLEPDPSYPAAWPPIAHLGPNCSALDGTYSNSGVFLPHGAHSGDGETALLLSSLLMAKEHAGAPSVTLEVVPQRVDKNGDTIASLRITLDDGAQISCGTRAVYCIDGDLFLPNARSSNDGLPFLIVQGSQSNLWLTQGADGSLIIRVSEYAAGVAVVVPYYLERGGWARFPRIDGPP